MLATQSRPVTSHATISTVGSTRLIGRDTQLAALRDAFVSAAEGGTHCVLVTGEAGIGKTRLVSEALAGLEGAVVVTGRAVDMSTGEIPFGVLADTLRDLIHVGGHGSLTTADHDALAPLLPGAPPSARVERLQLLSSFVDLLERLATDRFLVWVVEDLHWADSATRDLVNLAARTIRGSFLLIATVRTDDPDRSRADDTALRSYVAELARTPGCVVLPLGRLTADEVRLQLLALLGSSPAPELAIRIQELSDGVPFVVEELAAASGRPELATAAGVASARLTGLSPDTQRLVDAAAVGDGHLRISLVEQVLDATPDELDAALAEAVQAGILVSDAAADSLGFRHALLRDAADRAMGPGARRSWHRRWAEVLENNPGVLAADPAALAVAEHWHQARDARRALGATVTAIPSAGRICRPDEESVLWTRIVRAFGTVDDAAAIAGMSLRDVFALGLLCNIPASRSAELEFMAAVPLAELTPAERVAHREFSIETAKGEAATVPQDGPLELADAFEDADPDTLAVMAWASAGSLMATDMDRGEALIRRATLGARALANPRLTIAVAAVGSYRAQVNGQPDGGAALVREALATTGRPPWNGLLMMLGNLAYCEIVAGRYSQADEVLCEALASLRHPYLSLTVWEHLVENSAALWTRTGEWQRARALLEEASPWWDQDFRSSHARLTTLDLLQHGTADAEGWLALLGGGQPEGAPLAMIHDLVARSHVAADDLAGMRADLAGMWAHEHVVLSDDQLWATLLLAARAEADAALTGPRDDRDEALAHLGTLDALAVRFRRIGPLGEVWPLDLAAQLDRFHGRDARTPLHAALEGWERIGHVPDVAITHLSLAEQHAIHGDREAAREHLAAGREIAMSLEARPMLARADALADRYALTSRERQASDVLTGREAEVLGLLAEGRTNAEIATTLFMSPKTASVHVSRIIAKLGATNRTEAASIARRRALIP